MHETDSYILKNERSFHVTDTAEFKIKMLNWISRFNIFCLLDNHNYEFEKPAFDWMAGAGCLRSLTFEDPHAFNKLKDFHASKPSLLLGHISYNATGKAYQHNQSEPDFPPGFFFEPEYLVTLRGNILNITVPDGIDPEQIFNGINDTSSACESRKLPEVTPCISRQRYLDDIAQLKKHIQRGDCYEINYCMKFSAENADSDPVSLYKNLSYVSPNPFAAFYRYHDQYCFCASPERFLMKTGSRLLSQPIKGTSIRNLKDPALDNDNKEWLRGNMKEQAENVMITDLVRNDLSIVAEKGTVHVSELFGIYSFPQVHQMISSVEADLSEELHFTDAIDACFPPGSMTGAPKKKVMELIEKYEAYERGLFSGSIGYINASGDFDLNVVIRSIFFNAVTKQLSYFAGSGITFYCDAEKEYEECLAKAAAMQKALAL